MKKKETDQKRGSEEKRRAKVWWKARIVVPGNDMHGIDTVAGADGYWCKWCLCFCTAGIRRNNRSGCGSDRQTQKVLHP